MLEKNECVEEGFYLFCFNETDYDLTEGRGGIYEGYRKPAMKIGVTELKERS